LIVYFFLLAGVAVAGDDFQTWTQVSVKTLDTKYVDLVTFADIRKFHDAGDLGLYFISEQLKFDFWKNFGLGLNYTYLESKVNNRIAGRSELKFQHRAEVEVIPRWTVGDWLKVDLRNRVEFRWIEDNGSHNTRFRHRLTLDFPLKKTGIVKSVYTSSEFFYDHAKHEYNENRTVPVGLSLKITDKTSLKVYHMIQSTASADNWRSNQVLGALVSTSF
jgi:hypothetical protein